jgi:hypothetical protein
MTMAQIETATAIGSAYWACYLINGDCSGLDDREIAAADAWQAKLGDWQIVGIVEDSERFTWAYDIHCGGNTRGGDICDYEILRSA